MHKNPTRTRPGHQKPPNEKLVRVRQNRLQSTKTQSKFIKIYKNPGEVHQNLIKIQQNPQKSIKIYPESIKIN